MGGGGVLGARGSDREFEWPIGRGGLMRPNGKLNGLASFHSSGFEQDVEYGRIQHLAHCEGVRKEADSPETGSEIHVNFLIACTVSAFAFGAFVSGLAFSWYCTRALDRAKQAGKDAEGALARTISLPTLAKLTGLLDGQCKDGRAEGPTPQMYASLLVNCRTRATLRDPRPHYPELAALPTPDSTPELPPKNIKPFRSQWERAQGGPVAKDFDGRVPHGASPAPHPCGPQPFHIPSAMVLPNNAHGRDLILPSPADGHEEKKAWGPDAGLPLLPGELTPKVVDISTLDELLRHLQEMSANSRAALTTPRAPPPSGPPPRVPDLEDAAYYTSATLPRDGLSRARPESPPSPQRQAPRHHHHPHQHPPPQRHSLSTTFPKTNPTAPGLAKHHSFNQARGEPLLPSQDTAGPSGHPRGFPSRQTSHPGTVPRHSWQRGSRPDLPPKTPGSPTQPPTSPSDACNQ
ncbi:hypothetical protein scyTo_0022996 [Scyliorhinus torazame]|uniref:Uncharacterized protein n=1 Tax=Scyliorhinus torazame TaxID=75743 RepID=A0A401Q7Q9_SCYTO|nr:hypothetical protein [Scyliorhinus torazame]